MSTILGLLGIALFLFFLEIFVPGGILAVLGGFLIIAASGVGFQEYGVITGLSVLVGGSLIAVLFFYFELKFIGSSPIGRKIFGSHSVSSGKSGLDADPGLVGAEGVTLTKLVPGGKVKIGDIIYPATSMDGYLTKDTIVIVREIGAFTLKVSTR